MSKALIQKYHNDLATIRRVSGTGREGAVSEAFKDLLKGYARPRGLFFDNLHELPRQDGARRIVDGALLYDLRIPFGYWEAKDEDDDLDAGIAKKFRRGYPRDNIIFEDSANAVLIQRGNEVMRCKTADGEALARLLDLFFAHERAEVTDFRKAVVQFQTDLPQVLEALRGMIAQAQTDNAAFKTAAGKFLDHAHETINPSVTAEDVREMLIQHILTEEIFARVFEDSDFHRQNNVAKELYALENLFFTGALKKNTLRGLAPYYNAIHTAAQQITQHAEKQKFLKVIYEGFYKVYNPRAADRLGVVYTPNEIVKFMIESADWLCEKHFGKALVDKGVEILDPATGTGTFICELLEHFRGQPQKLAHKYKEELHANEVAILPYYVANLNIEATYAAIMGRFEEYPNLCFVDTLDNVAALGKFSGYQEEIFGAVSDENIARIKRQNTRKISVIIGNPPYNAWQENFNTRNPNRAYRRVDERIADTYIKRGTAQNKNSVYDMYTRFFRWASDRLVHEGIVAFITNRNFIEKAAFDGFRRVLAEEFAEIRLVDLGGDVRANPKLSGTKNSVFGIQTGVTICFLVRKAKAPERCRIFYARRPEDETREDKLSFLSAGDIWSLQFEEIRPDAKATWINQTDNDFDSLLPLALKSSKAAKNGAQDRAIFRLMSNGVKTQRDEWVYNFDRAALGKRMRQFVETYTHAVAHPKAKARFKIKWDHELERYWRNKLQMSYDDAAIIAAAYRPFVAAWLYFDRHFNGRTYQLPAMFRAGEENPTITFLCMASANDLATFACTKVFDLGLLKQGNGGTLGVSRYRYTPDGTRIDNITDWALEQFRAQYEAPGAPPSPLAGEGARRADEGFVPPHKQAVLRQFARSMRSEPTPAEAALWKLLRNRRFSGFKFRRQVPIGEFIADFVCFEQRLIVEADGSQHGDSPTDPVRDAWIAEQKFRVRRFWNNDILHEQQSVMDTIWADLAGATDLAGASRYPSSAPLGHLLPQGEKEIITKDAIFHYVYAVLHDPLYRQKYAQNLKRDFPRIPFYPDFHRWAAWGQQLMALHIGYESVEPWPLARTDVPDEKSRAAALPPKVVLKADRDNGIIVLDSETQLSGVPAAAWDYKLGNRSALDWILDQHKEKTPKDPTIREHFNTYRFKDHKEKVIDLLARVTRVSVETVAIVAAMAAGRQG